MESPEQSKRIEKQVLNIEKSANLRSEILNTATNVMLSLQKRFNVADRDIILFAAAFDEKIHEDQHVRISDPGALEALATQAINEKMQKLGVEYPGFTRSFLEEMRVKLMENEAANVAKKIQ